MFKTDVSLSEFDPEISAAIEAEKTRQEEHIELIASENHTSPFVMEAQGSVLTNKYAEGYPRKRYYGGCENVDTVEEIAIARAKALFNADYANVQPHSGSQANAAVYMALAKPGDTVLGMSLADGGHLTHGAKVSFSGRIYNSVQYGLNNETGEIDYDQVAALAEEHKPRIIVAGFSAYSRVIDWQKFRDIADKVGAYFLVDMAHVSGLIAAGVYPSPVNIADVTTSTTHKTLRGPRGGLILCRDAEFAKKFDKAVFPGSQGGPLEHVIAAKAVAFGEALQPSFKAYSQQVVANAAALAEQLIARGIDVVSGGTDNHVVLLDLRGIGMTGKVADLLVSDVHITANKNTVPFDPESPFVTSGLRLGTAALTTRGFDAQAFREVADVIADRLLNPEDDAIRQRCLDRVAALCERFPLYADSKQPVLA